MVGPGEDGKLNSRHGPRKFHPFGIAHGDGELRPVAMTCNPVLSAEGRTVEGVTPDPPVQAASSAATPRATIPREAEVLMKGRLPYFKWVWKATCSSSIGGTRTVLRHERVKMAGTPLQPDPVGGCSQREHMPGRPIPRASPAGLPRPGRVEYRLGAPHTKQHRPARRR
jgi:hypothetical protein